MITIYGTPWRRKPSLNRMKTKLKLVKLGILADTKHDAELLREKYPEAATILKSAEDLFLLADVVDEGLDGLFAKLSQFKNNDNGGN